MAAPPSWYSRYVALAPSEPEPLRSAYRSGMTLLHAGWSRYESPITITLFGGTCPLTQVGASMAASLAATGPSSEAAPPSPVPVSSPGTLLASSSTPDDEPLEAWTPEPELPELDPDGVPDPELLAPEPLDAPAWEPVGGMLVALPHPPIALKTPKIPSPIARAAPSPFMAFFIPCWCPDPSLLMVGVAPGRPSISAKS